MSSQAQVSANRKNAQKSTGPRTPEGKAVVSENAVKHGLSARKVVIHGEDRAEFDRFRGQLLGQLGRLGRWRRCWRTPISWSASWWRTRRRRT